MGADSDWNEALDSGLERALDAVEGAVSDTGKEVENTPAPEAEEQSAVDTTEAQVEEVEIAKAIEKQSKGRDQHGRFTKKAAPEEAAPTEEQVSDQSESTEQTAPLTEQSDVSPSQVPVFWSAKMKAAAEATQDKALLQAFIEHDEQREQAFRRFTAESQGSKAFQERLNADMAPEEVTKHRAQLQAAGIRDEIEELHRYRAWDKVMRSDIRSYIKGLVANNGLSPYDIFAEDGSIQQNQSQPQFDPEEIVRKANEAAEAKIKEFEKTQQQREIENEVSAFKQGKDSFGEVRGKFWDMYEPQIGQAIAMVRQQNPYASRNEVLNHAYEAVKSAIYDLHGIKPGAQKAPVPPQKDPKQLHADAQKAKAASGSISGGPASGVTPKARPKSKGDWNKTLDEGVDAAFDALGL